MIVQCCLWLEGGGHANVVRAQAGLGRLPLAHAHHHHRRPLGRRMAVHASPIPAENERAELFLELPPEQAVDGKVQSGILGDQQVAYVGILAVA